MCFHDRFEGGKQLTVDKRGKLRQNLADHRADVIGEFAQHTFQSCISLGIFGFAIRGSGCRNGNLAVLQDQSAFKRGGFRFVLLGDSALCVSGYDRNVVHQLQGQFRLFDLDQVALCGHAQVINQNVDCFVRFSRLHRGEEAVRGHALAAVLADKVALMVVASLGELRTFGLIGLTGGRCGSFGRCTVARACAGRVFRGVLAACQNGQHHQACEQKCHAGKPCVQSFSLHLKKPP